MSPPPSRAWPARAGLLDRLAPAVRQAGQLIERYRRDGFAVRSKPAGKGHAASPVTDADEAAEALLAAAIRAADPATPIVGEEASAAGVQPPPGPRFWLIDPLDGTRAFVRGGGDYSVNIGLVEAGVPVLGLVLHPPTAMLWAGAAGVGAWREAAAGERVRIGSAPLAGRPRIAISRSNPDAPVGAFLAALPGAEVRPSGSSLKFCLLAEGSADVYPRHGPTNEWDTAAGDAVLRAAGGMVFGADGRPFRYGKPAYLNGPFLALGDRGARMRLPPFPPAS